MDNEAKVGLELIREEIERTRILNLVMVRQIEGPLGPYYLVFQSGQNKVDISLSREFLSDLPATQEYKVSLESYLRTLEKRIKNSSPHDFYCRSGVPIRIEITWPFYSCYGKDGSPRAASWLAVSVKDLRRRQLESHCAVEITHQQDRFDLQRDPFRRLAAIVNSIRKAVDGGHLDLDEAELKGDRRITIPLDLAPPKGASTREVLDFIEGKTFWLAFKQGSKASPVWIDDPWDSSYLGIEDGSMVQSAEISESQGTIVLDKTHQYASIGKELLRRAPNYETGESKEMERPIEETEDIRKTAEWDVFICHASEDKADFVRPLAEALKEAGLKVWYDEFSLKVGDRLLESIDKGLANSRWGIIVLSPHFFQKEWPKNELEGLMAKEVGGQKVILPVWHTVSAEEVRKHSPILAGRIAINSSEGMEKVVEALRDAMRPEEAMGFQQMMDRANFLQPKPAPVSVSIPPRTQKPSIKLLLLCEGCGAKYWLDEYQASADIGRSQGAFDSYVAGTRIPYQCRTQGCPNYGRMEPMQAIEGQITRWR